MAREMPQLEGVQHHFVDVDGLRMHYAVAGPADGEPVVLVHGWPQHWFVWRRVIPRLADRFRVIAPDLRGFGWTDAPDSSYGKDELGRDIAGLLRALDLENVRLSGHDWGGLAAFWAAIEAPERVRSVTCFAIIHPWAKGRPTLGGVLAAAVYQPQIGMPFLGPALQRFTPFVHLPFLASGVYRTFLLRELRKRPPVGRMEVPARLILGRNDPICTPEVNGGAAGRGIELEVVDGGHWLPESKPDLVAERIASA